MLAVKARNWKETPRTSYETIFFKVIARHEQKSELKKNLK